ncbi:MAG TPA: hypothetical protein DCZ48_08065 [Methylococcaceae bacterium]|nr:hypothetical protein [Methylococcaceae bacterium]
MPKEYVQNNFPIKFSVHPEPVEGWAENSLPMLRQAQHERVTAFREVIFDGILRNMRKITSQNNKLCGNSVTRSTRRCEYIHVGLAAAIPAADTCQSSHRTPFRHLMKLFHARF